MVKMKVGDKNGTSQKKHWELEDKKLLSLLMGRKGGKTTIKIIDTLLGKPCNANQLSDLIHVDYNTVTFHLKILLEHRYVERIQFGKPSIFHPSDKLIKSYDEYLIIKDIIEKE